MADIFIAYSHDERARVKPLAEALEAEGWSVWWDPKLQPGETWDEVIDREINAAKCVVAVWSEVSIKSDWVKEEAEDGKKRGLLVSALIGDVEAPRGFRRQQAANLASWDGTAADPQFRLLAEGITAKVLRTPKRGAGEPSGARAEPKPTPATSPAPPAPPASPTPKRATRTSPKPRARRATKTGASELLVTEVGGVELVSIPAGSFMMGSPTSEKGRFGDEGQHRVTVPAFAIGRYADSCRWPRGSTA